MKSTRFCISIAAGILGGIVILSGCSASKSVGNQDVESTVVTVELNGRQLKGLYDGELDNGFPSGYGEITITDEESEITSIVGEFGEGELDGEIEVKFSDGSVESGNTKKGYYSGRIIKTEQDGSYQYIRYTKGQKIGKTVFYNADGSSVSQNWYYTDTLLTDYIDGAVEYDIREYYKSPYMHIDEIVKMEGYVENVFQSEEECIIKICVAQNQKIYALYPNGKYNRKKPTIVPVIEAGDYVTVYGMFNGTLQNEYSMDVEDYGFSFPEISIFYAEVEGSDFDAFERPTEPYDYYEIVNCPYSYSDMPIELKGTVENTIVDYEEDLIYCRLITTEGYVYYVEITFAKLGELEVPLAGDDLNVEGTIMGNYKQAGMSEGTQNYEAYPLITTSKIYE